MKNYLLILFVWLAYFPGSLMGQTDAFPSDQGQINPIEDPMQPQRHQDPNIMHDHIDKDADNFQAKFFNMLLVLGLLIGFMILASWMLKRMTRVRVEQLNTASDIKILETRHLSPKSTIYLLDVMGQGLVIAETPTNVSHLATIPLQEPEPTPSAPTAKPKFDVDRI